VIIPAKCVSSFFPRFHYRKLTFCFLPLAAILEFLRQYILDLSINVPILEKTIRVTGDEVKKIGENKRRESDR
jgi:hypothetical protein